MNFFNTGCLIYPLSMTCNEKLIWSISLEQVHAMNNWYQLWSKGGATPNSIVQDKDTYIEGFNWVNHWFTSYFVLKIIPFILLIFISL